MSDETPRAHAAHSISTSIPYVNARPHIGHALEDIQADALARYYRLAGADVHFLSGTDENSLKNVRAAEQEGIETRALVERNAAYFAGLRDTLNLSYDDFIRTSADPRHQPGVVRLWEACAQRGDIYRRAYSGLYCVGCEQFYAEEELENGLCPDHQTRPELIEEENYFFRLSRYADPLLELIESGRLAILPGSRRNEVLSFIRAGLSDFSISRSQERARGWGVPVPGDPGQVIYVWFDALVNYITALGYADDGPRYRRYWAEAAQRTHVIGKNIIRFHAVYWPAMLLSAGVPLPTRLLVHGFVTSEGRKISKSLGNTIDPAALAAQYGADALRYYLLRAIPSGEDGDFSAERFRALYRADLADQLGNLLSRTTAMVERYYAGLVPAPGAPGPEEQGLIERAGGLAGRLDHALARFALHEGLAAVWELVEAANAYVVAVAPWALAKRRAAGDQAAEPRLACALYTLVETLRIVAHGSAPFLPATAAAVAEQLGIALDTGGWQAALRWGGYPAGTRVRSGAVLFPKDDR